MKTRFFSLIALFACMTLAAFADSRTVAEAQREALRFLVSASSSAKMAPSAQSVQLAYTLPKINSSEDAAYLFQVGEDGGYVLVSADDNAQTILGYANEGRFDANDIPDNMQVWLQHYAEEIAWVSQQGSRIMKADNGAVTQTAAAPIQPLLGGIVWNQGTPFWNQCPYDSDGDRCYTGCVATAAAQIMRFWKHPQQGTGSHSYTWTKTNGSTQTLSANFNTTYDWANMLENYYTTDGYNTTQANAVAKLMSHLGVATEMGYSSDGSGTQTAKEVRAMFTYFGYDKSVRAVMPDFVGSEAFEAEMLSELQANRPVLMSGATVNNEGHAFVCDGYDGTYFHINWGWGGSQNGYFALSALDPAEQGMGGAASGAGFHVRVAGFMGIKPDEGGQPTNGQIGTYGLFMSSYNTVKTTDYISVSLNQIHNIGIPDYAGGYLGIGVYDDKGNFVCTFGGFYCDELPVGAYYVSNGIPFNGNLAKLSADGTYRFVPVYSDVNQENFWPMQVSTDSPQYIEFIKSGNDIIFQVEEDPTIDYSINNLTARAEDAYVYFTFESDAPQYHVKIYNDEETRIDTYIDFNNVRASNMPDGIWTIWVCGADNYKIDRGEPATIEVTVGEVEEDEGAQYDVNGDGQVDEKDVTLLRNYILGRTVPAGFNVARADVNKDGKVNVADVLAVVEYIRTHNDDGEDNWEFGSNEK